MLFLGNTELVSVEPADWQASVEHREHDARRGAQSSSRTCSAIPSFSVSFSGDVGLQRIAVTHDGDKWTPRREVDEPGLEAILQRFRPRRQRSSTGSTATSSCCVDATTGKRRWKGGRYGSGQVLLVADKPVLLVITETGEAVLVAANPEKHDELGRFQAIEGKTWNHPTIVGRRLYVRNAEEMACYEL